MFLCVSKKKKRKKELIYLFTVLLVFPSSYPLLNRAVVSTVSGVTSCICYLNCELSFNLSIDFPICSSEQMSKTTQMTLQGARSHCEFMESSLATSMRSCRGKYLSYASMKLNKFLGFFFLLLNRCKFLIT